MDTHPPCAGNHSEERAVEPIPGVSHHLCRAPDSEPEANKTTLYQVLGYLGDLGNLHENTAGYILGHFASLDAAITNVTRYHVEICSYLYCSSREPKTNEIFGETLPLPGVRCTLRIEEAPWGFEARNPVVWACVYESTRNPLSASTWQVVAMTPHNPSPEDNPWQGKDPESENATNVASSQIGQHCFGMVSPRGLQVVLLLDTSNAHQEVKLPRTESIVKEIFRALSVVSRKILAEVYLRIVQFGETASWHVGPDPTTFAELVWSEPVTAHSSRASLKSAIDLLLPELSDDKLGKRYHPPLILLLSDGHFTESADEFDAIINDLNQHPVAGIKANRIAITYSEEPACDLGKLDKFPRHWCRTDYDVRAITPCALKNLARIICGFTTPDPDWPDPIIDPAPPPPSGSLVPPIISDPW